MLLPANLLYDPALRAKILHKRKSITIVLHAGQLHRRIMGTDNLAGKKKRNSPTRSLVQGPTPSSI
jgi:hypothetical protein